MARPAIIVHGGAGDWPSGRQRKGMSGVKAAVEAGWKVLKRNGSSMDAVQASVVSMEDNPIFNAGSGSALNLGGHVEMDAAIMDGERLSGGAVAMVRAVKNPVRLARIVMEETDHILIAGPGAEWIARAYNLPRSNPKTGDRVRAWQRGLALFKRGKAKRLARNRKFLREGWLGRGDTVGALAIDGEGFLAAACSTGGLSLKLPGRIGDTAILGAGLFADNRVGAATATGIGELAIRTAISKTACELMGRSSADIAARRCIKDAGQRVGRGLGIITMDLAGRYGVAHSTRRLCWASMDELRGLRVSLVGTRL